MLVPTTTHTLSHPVFLPYHVLFLAEQITDAFKAVFHCSRFARMGGTKAHRSTQKHTEAHRSTQKHTENSQIGTYGKS